MLVSMPGTGVPGRWTVAMGGSRQSSAVTLYRCSDLHLEILPPAEGLSAGTPTTLEAVVRDASGAVADLSEYRGERPTEPPTIAATSDSATDLSARFRDLAHGTIEVTLIPPSDKLATRINLAFTPRLGDRRGTALAQVSGSRVLEVVPPDTFPTIEPADELDLGVAEGTAAAQGMLRLRGSDRGATQVCLGRAIDSAAPESAGPVRISAQVGCRELAQGSASRRCRSRPHPRSLPTASGARRSRSR